MNCPLAGAFLRRVVYFFSLMRFQLWGNSRCHIQLWEPMPTVNPCDRAFRLFAIDYDDQTTIDGIGICYSSQFHADKETVAEIKKKVDDFNQTQSDDQSSSDDVVAD